MQRHQRLRRRSDFAETYRSGRSWASPLLVVRARPNGGPFTRFGFAVGKRIGKAVLRNRLKRQLRAIARELPVASGWDIIIVARATAGSAAFSQLRGALSALVARAGLQRPAADAGKEQQR